MTNIGAIKVPGRKNKPEYLVFVADSMGSFLQNRSKVDNFQKLFKIGDYVLMGTGDGNLVRDMATRLSSNGFSSAREVVTAVLENSHDYKLTKNDGLNFIVGGKDPDGLQIYHINTTGFTGDPKTSDHKNRGFSKSPMAFDGSGFRFVNEYINGIGEAGKDLIIKDVADGLSKVYDFAKKGARDSGVNDKLQYGIISPNGISRLYHPSVKSISNEACVEYLREMTGVDIKPPNPKAKFKVMEQEAERVYNLENVLASNYLALDRDLHDLSTWDIYLTRLGEEFKHDLATPDDLKRIKRKFKKSKANVMKGAQALVDRGLGNLIGYNRNFDERQKVMEEKALSYKKA